MEREDATVPAEVAVEPKAVEPLVVGLEATAVVQAVDEPEIAACLRLYRGGAKGSAQEANVEPEVVAAIEEVAAEPGISADSTVEQEVASVPAEAQWLSRLGEREVVSVPAGPSGRQAAWRLDDSDKCFV